MAQSISKSESGDDMKDARLYSAVEASQYLGLGKTTFLRMVKDSDLPQPIRITERRIVWDVRDLDAYIDTIKAEKTPKFR